MTENWEIHWKDYYEILQVHRLAEPVVVEAAHRNLALKYHPDRNPDPSAAARMKDINEAHEVLSNPDRKKRYDSEWAKRVARGGAFAPKPKPSVEPQYIRFANVQPGEVKKASFVVRNLGGAYSKIWVSNPDSWVKVVSYASLTKSDELPLQVEIEAKGDEWGKTYTEHIRVKLDEEETQVKVELQTIAETEWVKLKRAQAYSEHQKRLAQALAEKEGKLWRLHLAVVLILVPAFLGTLHLRTLFSHSVPVPVYEIFQLLLVSTGSTICLVFADRIWSVGKNEPGDEWEGNWLWLALLTFVVPFICAVIAIITYIRGMTAIFSEYNDDIRQAENQYRRTLKNLGH